MYFHNVSKSRIRPSMFPEPRQFHCLSCSWQFSFIIKFFKVRDSKAKFVLFYCTIGIVESLPLNQMCSWWYVVRFLLPSTGQQVHFQCIWISQPFCSSFAPVTHVTSLTGYASNEFLMSWRERKEWSSAHEEAARSWRTRDGDSGTSEMSGGLEFTTLFGSCCSWGALAWTPFCPAVYSLQ